MEKPDIYLDIDGVLRGSYAPQSDVVSFVEYILDEFPGQIYWLTTHCKHGTNNTLYALKTAFAPDLAERLFKEVKPTDWNTLKTDGINFNHDFIWFDDNLFLTEEHVLRQKGLLQNIYVVNSRLKTALADALVYLKVCPIGESAPLRRFTMAIQRDYAAAEQELSAGVKYGHYMWYMFPQIQGLGISEQSVYYAIRDEIEAVQFLNDNYLSDKLIQLCKILLTIPENDPAMIFSDIDAMKLRSSMTLFATTYANNRVELNSQKEYGVFQAVLEKFFDGNLDEATLVIIG